MLSSNDEQCNPKEENIRSPKITFATEIQNTLNILVRNNSLCPRGSTHSGPFDKLRPKAKPKYEYPFNKHQNLAYI